jgi:hypothetical protein
MKSVSCGLFSMRVMRLENSIRNQSFEVCLIRHLTRPIVYAIPPQLSPLTTFLDSLGVRRERPRRRRAAEQRDELATFHSITSSARPSSESGTVRPSALAVLRLMISSILVDC